MYYKTSWIEDTMSSTAKVTALTNLETIYSEAVAYIVAFDHSSTYYNKTEVNAKFFSAGNDGTGSGCICKTLDGKTAAEIVESSIPQGAIVLWSGTVETVPTGFYVCDGLNGTPNLKDRFVMCSGSSYPKGYTGGYASVTLSATVSINSHPLTAAEIPLHTHTGIIDNYPIYVTDGPTGAGSNRYVNGAVETPSYTLFTGSGVGHTHSTTFNGSVAQEKLPPYYSILFIMKGS
jgi:hypothetical protein